LRALLAAKPTSFRLYDGFEPSGRMHIAQGVFKAVNVNKCTAAGGTFVFWVRAGAVSTLPALARHPTTAPPHPCHCLFLFYERARRDRSRTGLR
jgi:hypothetical protein